MGNFYIESQLAKGVISIRIPTDTDIINSKSAIRSVFFLGLFVLKRTASATPLFIRSPDIIAPAVSILSTYSSLINSNQGREYVCEYGLIKNEICNIILANIMNQQIE